MWYDKCLEIIKAFGNAFLNVLNSEVFCTVLSGVLVFIISQFVLELVIKPRVKYKETLSKILYSLTYYADVISNPMVVSTDKEKQKKDFDSFKDSKYSLASDELRKLGSEIKTYSFKKKRNNHISKELIFLSNSLWNYENTTSIKEGINSTHLHDLLDYISNNMSEGKHKK